ncbi:MAG TPA: hypothetical protein VNK70_01005 [Candidatus Paceibacterota bacterium]|nr:hypothetical protein [Candidatus Paceibacterota bacterium]
MTILKAYILSALVGAFILFVSLSVIPVLADSVTPSVTVGNAAPSVSAVDISPATITLTENGTTTITITATITDSNGCSEVFTGGTIKAQLYRSGVSGAGSCSADPNNCYRNITMTDVGGTCAGGSDTSGNASGTVQIWYIAEATDASSSFSTETWQVEVIATDSSNASSSATDSTPPELSTLLALDVTASLSYGTVAANATSATVSASTTNTGNYNTLDAQFSGVALESGANSIAAAQQKYSTTTSEAYEQLDYTLSTTPTFRELNIAKATATTTPSKQGSFWAILIPAGQAAGTYNGTTTITAY